jgi:hypothetical protein
MTRVFLYFLQVCFVLIIVNFLVETRSWSRPRISCIQPIGRHGHSFTAIENKIYMFGGLTEEGYTDELWVLEDVYNPNPRWIKIDSANGPGARAFHSVVVVGSQLVIFGGECGFDCYNDVFTFDTRTSSWTAIRLNSGPSERYQHSSYAHGHNMTIFGGKDYQGTALNEVWLLDLKSEHWRFLGNLPTSRCQDVVFLAGTKLMLLGGTSDETNALPCIAIEQTKLKSKRGLPPSPTLSISTTPPPRSPAINNRNISLPILETLEKQDFGVPPSLPPPPSPTAALGRSPAPSFSFPPPPDCLPPLEVAKERVPPPLPSDEVISKREYNLLKSQNQELIRKLEVLKSADIEKAAMKKLVAELSAKLVAAEKLEQQVKALKEEKSADNLKQDENKNSEMETFKKLLVGDFGLEKDLHSKSVLTSASLLLRKLKYEVEENANSLDLTKKKLALALEENKIITDKTKSDSVDSSKELHNARIVMAEQSQELEKLKEELKQLKLIQSENQDLNAQIALLKVKLNCAEEIAEKGKENIAGRNAAETKLKTQHDRMESLLKSVQQENQGLKLDLDEANKAVIAKETEISNIKKTSDQELKKLQEETKLLKTSKLNDIQQEDQLQTVKNEVEVTKQNLKAAVEKASLAEKNYGEVSMDLMALRKQLQDLRSANDKLKEDLENAKNANVMLNVAPPPAIVPIISGTVPPPPPPPPTPSVIAAGAPPPPPPPEVASSGDVTPARSSLLAEIQAGKKLKSVEQVPLTPVPAAVTAPVASDPMALMMAEMQKKKLKHSEGSRSKSLETKAASVDKELLKKLNARKV